MDDPLDAVLARPAPVVASEEAQALAARHFGVHGAASALAGERDCNVRLTADGAPGWMLKIIHPDEDPEVTDLQTTALRHLEERAPELTVSRVVAPYAARARLRSGQRCGLRLTTWIDGIPLARSAIDAISLAGDLGRILARIDLALADLRHPAEDHPLLWNVSRLLADHDAVERLVAPHGDLAAAFAPIRERLGPHLRELPAQLIHNDLNPHNVIFQDTVIVQQHAIVQPAKPGAEAVSLGVIDVGDLVRAPRVQDPATAAAYLVDPSDPLRGPADLLAAYAGVLPLSGSELAAFLDLVIARLVLAMAISRHRASRHPGNADYILRNHARTHAGLAALVARQLHETGWSP